MHLPINETVQTIQSSFLFLQSLTQQTGEGLRQLALNSDPSDTLKGFVTVAGCVITGGLIIGAATLTHYLGQDKTDPRTPLKTSQSDTSN